jgi:hypothetical protein
VPGDRLQAFLRDRRGRGPLGGAARFRRDHGGQPLAELVRDRRRRRSPLLNAIGESDRLPSDRARHSPPGGPAKASNKAACSLEWVSQDCVPALTTSPLTSSTPKLYVSVATWRISSQASNDSTHAADSAASSPSAANRFPVTVPEESVSLAGLRPRPTSGVVWVAGPGVVAS